MRGAVILAVLAVILLAATAQAFPDKNTRRGGGCFDNGQLIFAFGGEGRDSYDPEGLNVTAQQFVGLVPGGRNITLEGWWYYSDPQIEPVVWSDTTYVEYIEYPNWTNVYFYNPDNAEDVNSKPSMFASKEGYIREPGQYRVRVLNSTGDVIHSTDLACPGLRFACDLLNITIDRCSNPDGKFRAIFGVDGMNQSHLPDAKEVSLLKDFNYRLEGDYPLGIHATFPKGAKLTHLGGPKYTLELDVPFEIINFSLEMKECRPEHPFYYEGAREKRACEPAPECHTYAECDDSDACTLDTCFGGRCVHEDLCIFPEARAPAVKAEPPKNIFQLWWEAMTEFFRVFGGV
ncbi:MAG: hypothetical protein ACE5FW_03355 [Candidatus Aenigmatarchaeota archaeon]